jgi:hypothetical protein
MGVHMKDKTRIRRTLAERAPEVAAAMLTEQASNILQDANQLLTTAAFMAGGDHVAFTRLIAHRDRSLLLAVGADELTQRLLGNVRDDLTEAAASNLYMRYLGVLALLGRAAAYVGCGQGEDLYDQITNAIEDACQHHPLKAHRVGHRIDITPHTTDDTGEPAT